MKFVWKVLFALLTGVFMCGAVAEAAEEWVQIYRPDVPVAEWVKINTGKRPGQILHINGRALVIDIGMSRGARKGGLFLVYAEKNRATQALAVIRVAQTAGEFSICEMTPYVVGGEVCIGDLVTPASISAERDTIYADPSVLYRENVTEGFVSAPRVYGVPANVAAAVPAPVISGVPATVPAADAYVTSQMNIAAPIPAPAPISPTPIPTPVATPAYVPAAVPIVAPVAVPGPVPPAPAPKPPYDLYGRYNYAPPAPQPAPAPQTYAAPPVPQAYHVPQAPATPYVQESPYPNNVTYPPYPNYQNAPAVQLDFDANKITDARLIRTFPISQPEMNALEIQFRGAAALYNKGDYYGAFQAFAGQFQFGGNYLSPYWAGLCALKLGNRHGAIDMLNQSLSINPYYEPARNAIVAAQTYVPQPTPKPQPPAQPKIQKRVRRSK